MIRDLNKIFEIWKDKVGSKRTPNPKSAEHQYQLREILNDLNWDEEVITELIYNLTEKREPGETWQTQSGWAGLKPGEDSARYGMDSEETADAYVRGEQIPGDEEDEVGDEVEDEKSILDKLDKNQKSARKHIMGRLDIEQIKSDDPDLSDEEIQHIEETKELFDEFLNNDTSPERKRELALELKDKLGLTTNKPLVDDDGNPNNVKLYIKKNHDGGKVPRTIEKLLTTKNGGGGAPQTRLVSELNKHLDEDNQIQPNTIGGQNERKVAQTFETAAKPSFVNEDGSPTGRKAKRRNPKANFRRKDPDNPGYDRDGNALYETDPVVTSIFQEGTPLGDLKESYHEIEGPSDDDGNLVSANTPEGQRTHMRFLVERNQASQRVKDECDKILNDPNVNESEKEKFRNIKKSIEDYEKEMKSIIDKVPSKEAAQKVEELNAKLMDDLFNSHPDIAGGMAKQMAENALVSEELAAGDEVYMPTSGVFPGGDKIHVTREGQQIVGVAGISVKFGRASKETQVYGFPGESQSMARFAEPKRKEGESDDDYKKRKEELRTRNGGHVGQEGHSIGVRDDIVTDAKKQEEIIEQSGMGDAITDKKEFHTITNDVKNEVTRFMVEQRKKVPPPSEKAIKIQLQKHLKKWMKDNKINERLDRCVDRKEFTRQLTGSEDGYYIDKDGNRRRHSNTLIAQNSDPIEMINIMAFGSTVKEGQGMPSLAWNHQSYEDGEYHTETVNPNENDMTDLACWGFSSRMYVSSSRNGGGILSTGTCEGSSKRKPLKNS